eukprot:1139502-Pelagomonas_calceolata.AAC.10
MLAEVAVHTPACACKLNWSAWGRLFIKSCSGARTEFIYCCLLQQQAAHCGRPGGQLAAAQGGKQLLVMEGTVEEGGTGRKG